MQTQHINTTGDNCVAQLRNHSCLKRAGRVFHKGKRVRGILLIQ